LREKAAPKTLNEQVGFLLRQFESENRARLRVVVEGWSRELHPVVRHEVYRISCEAIRNAFQHAGARAIEAEIRYSNSLRVRIRDDGKGIDPGNAKRAKEGRLGHYGLVGIHERAAGIGAHLTVWSAPGLGTEIELSIPDSIAYGSSGTGACRKLRLEPGVPSNATELRTRTLPGFCSQRRDTGFSHETVAIGGREATPVAAQLLP